MLSLDVKPIGVVRLAHDGRAVLEVHPAYLDGLQGLGPGDRVQVLYWMHELGHGERRLLRLHPGGHEGQPKRGVFALRSCIRPNPIGVSEAEVVEVREAALVVVGLDARDGSPLLDVKAACP